MKTMPNNAIAPPELSPTSIFVVLYLVDFFSSAIDMNIPFFIANIAIILENIAILPVKIRIGDVMNNISQCDNASELPTA